MARPIDLYPTPTCRDYKGTNGTLGLVDNSGSFPRWHMLPTYVASVLEGEEIPDTGKNDHTDSALAEIARRRKEYLAYIGDKHGK